MLNFKLPSDSEIPRTHSLGTKYLPNEMICILLKSLYSTLRKQEAESPEDHPSRHLYPRVILSSRPSRQTADSTPLNTIAILEIFPNLPSLSPSFVFVQSPCFSMFPNCQWDCLAYLYLLLEENFKISVLVSC